MARGLVFALLLPACSAPPEAPAELEELCAYLYAHHPDEDPAALQAGLERLLDWFEEEWDDPDEQGYEVAPLDEATADAVDGSAAYVPPEAKEDRTTEGMISLAVGTEHGHPVEDYAYALLVPSQDEVYPDMFTEYSREFTSGDPDCFLDRDCMRVEALEEMTTAFALGLSTHSEIYDQYLWVELERGWAFFQRNWQVYPPETNFAALAVDEQFYINLFLPRSGGGAWRLQVTWEVSTSDVPEDTVKVLVVDDMFGNSDTLEAWVDENL